MDIPKIFNSLLEADRPSEGSIQLAEPDHQEGHVHLTIQGKRFSRAVCLTN